MKILMVALALDCMFGADAAQAGSKPGVSPDSGGAAAARHHGG